MKISKMLILIIIILISFPLTQAQISEEKRIILENNLIAYYNFQDISSLEVMDKSGNQNVGTMHNMSLDAYSDSTLPSGKNGQVLNFDGVDDYFEVPHDKSFDFSNGLTISAWVKTNRENHNGNYQTIISKSGGSGEHQFSFYFRPNGHIGGWYSLDGDKVHSFDSDMEFELDEWYHVVYTHNNETLRVYVNDELESEVEAGEEIYDGTGDIRIGGWARNPNYQLKGEISEIRIYNQALAEQEIKEIFRATGPVFHLKNIETSAGWTTDAKHEQVLNFDGVDDYFEVPHDKSFDFSNGLTISAWVKTNRENHNGNYQTIISKSGGSGEHQFSFYFRPNGHIGGWYSLDGDKVHSFDSDMEFELDEWYHVVYTHNNETLRVYVNDELESEVEAGEEIYDGTGDIRIGGWARNPNYQLKGEISEIRIYNQALAEQEIKELYDGGNLEKNLVAHFPLNEGIGEKVYDQSPNSLVGTIHSKIRARENIDLLTRIHRTERENVTLDFEANLNVYIEGEKVLSKSIDPSEIGPGGEHLVEIPWTPEKIKEYEVKAVLEYEGTEMTSTRTFDVGPPLNPPLHYLYATAMENKDGINLELEPWSPWQEEYEKVEWNASAEVKVYRDRLLRSDKTLETTYIVNDSPFEFTIPHDDFYEEDGKYTIEIKFQDEVFRTEMEVAGEDGVYDPPKELAWVIAFIGIAIALALAYVAKSIYGKNR